MKFEHISKESHDIPWQIYPRPQMKRDSFFCLNGEWEFAVTESEAPPDRYERTILVPFPPESALSGIEEGHRVGEWLHYRRRFLSSECEAHTRVLLHFGAVDQIACVCLNGIDLGTHEGGYLPFTFDITEALSPGENILTVSVRDDLDQRYPYGKQTHKRGGMWYTPVSGIWQTVWLECVKEGYIRSLTITASMTRAEIAFESDSPVRRVILADGTVYLPVDNKVTIEPAEKNLWSPESPCLYTFTAEGDNDRIEGYFALREIHAAREDGVARLYLNGRPYFFHGLLDQGYFDDGIFLPKTPSGYENDILTAKSLGFNMLRKHIKIEPLLFYHLCDVHGMAVFQDVPNNGSYSFLRDTALPTVGIKRLKDRYMHRDPAERRIFQETMLDMARHLQGSPSVLFYTIFNEGWGQFCADEMYELLKKEDPSRIIDATSGWFVQKKSDVDSRHVYFKKVKYKKGNGRPFVLSEFGGYSLRIEGHVYGKDNYGYKQMRTAEELTDSLAKLYREQILPLIGRGLCADVLTQLSDVEDETNGLMTYDREIIKVDEDTFRAIGEEIKKALLSSNPER